MGVDLDACWACALWSGVAAKLIRERLADTAKKPLIPEARAAIISRINRAVSLDPYLGEVACDALAEMIPL